MRLFNIPFLFTVLAVDQERDSELSELREEVRAQGLQMVDIVSTVEGLRRASDRQQARGRLSPRSEASEVSDLVLCLCDCIDI